MTFSRFSRLLKIKGLIGDYFAWLSKVFFRSPLVLRVGVSQAVVEKKVPKSVKKNLLENEQVIGKTASAGADFYATNKRLIKRQRSIIGEWLFSFDFFSFYLFDPHLRLPP